MSTGRWGTFTSFPLQLFIFTIFPLAALLIILVFSSLGLHQRAMRTMVGERDERTSRAASIAISELLSHRLSAIQRIARQAAGGTQSPEAILADAADLPPYFDGGIALFTKSGELLATSDRPGVWLEYPLTDYLPEGYDPSDPAQGAIFPPLMGSTRGDPFILAVASRDDIMAVGAFNPATVVDNVVTDIFSSQEQATIYIVTPTGEILYQNGPPSWSHLPVADHPGVTEALSGQSGTTYLEIEGQEIVIAYNTIQPVGWALVIEEPWGLVTDPLLRMTEWAPLILIPVLVIALLALWFGARQIVQPLQSLEEKATQLGWGDFKAIEEPVGGINEINRLQTELIHMAQKVRQGQQNLRGYLGAVTTGQEEERRRLARELHDDTIQSLIALNQQVQLAQLAASEDPTRERLESMQQMVRQIVSDLRRLTRDLRPIYLEDLGLIPALEMLAQDMEKALQLPVSFEKRGAERRLPPEVELALYRITQESLNNVGKHAQAAHAEIQLGFGDKEVTLAVRDNGRGFDVPESPAAMVPAGHYGLLGIQERAEAIGARVHLQSTYGAGTELVVVYPNQITTAPG